MNLVLGVALPLLVVFTMFVVGLSLTRAEFANVARHPRVTLIALAGQWLLPPTVAVSLVKVLNLPGVLAMGVILAAAAPPGAISNYYALLARARVALAVTLTAISSLGAAIATPLLASLAHWFALRESAAFTLPAAKMLQQTVIGLLLPVLVGMAVRHFVPSWVARHESKLRGLALLAVALVVAFIITDQITLIRDQLVFLLQTAALFTGVLLAAGWLLGRFASDEVTERRALLFGFPARNMAVASLLAVAAFGRVDIAAFAAVFFLVQVIVLVPLALLLGQARR
ncbi:MAG: bile acid:sodium symporter [Betaproteobacteria bacterium]|nr:bile acid:sodium symporter [Betaproteobacteria bacterium]